LASDLSAAKNVRVA